MVILSILCFQITTMSRGDAVLKEVQVQVQGCLRLICLRVHRTCLNLSMCQRVVNVVAAGDEEEIITMEIHASNRQESNSEMESVCKKL